MGLDLLRLVAVLLVLGAHFREVPTAGEAWFRAWNRGGWVGVDLFFVLSGFLVAGLLFREQQRVGRVEVGRFLVRRGWKIYPPFWLLIAFTVAIPFLFQRRPPTPLTLSAVTAEVFFYQNYVRGLWGHTWSLAVEEHFYLSVAIALRYLAGRTHHSEPFRWIPFIFGGMAVVCFGLRLATEWWHSGEEYDWFTYCGTHLRLDSLWFGVLLAYLSGREVWARRIDALGGRNLTLLGSGLMLPAFFVDISIHHWCWPGLVVLLYLGAGMLVLGAIRISWPTSPVIRFAAALGAASYSIYLWHFVVNIYGTRAVEIVTGMRSPWLYVGVYVLGSLAWGWLVSRMIETPILRIRDLVVPARSDALSSPLSTNKLRTPPGTFA